MNISLFSSWKWHPSLPCPSNARRWKACQWINFALQIQSSIIIALGVLYWLHLYYHIAAYLCTPCPSPYYTCAILVCLQFVARISNEVIWFISKTFFGIRAITSGSDAHQQHTSIDRVWPRSLSARLAASASGGPNGSVHCILSHQHFMVSIKSPKFDGMNIYLFYG